MPRAASGSITMVAPPPVVVTTPTAARRAAREQRSDHAARMRGRKDAPDRQLGLLERRVGGQQRLRAQIDDAEARRPDDAQTRARADLAQARDARGTVVAGFRKTVS